MYNKIPNKSTLIFFSVQLIKISKYSHHMVVEGPGRSTSNQIE